ncbi:MAG: HPr family phosphocarrier protein [Lachnospiraceae bacterium]|nr:HPr family phosphocarrier protein [Lachnospiraceae bacterium]
MVSKKVTIINPTGLHLRPAGLLCNEAMRFDSHVSFNSKGNVTANAKSVLSVLAACVKWGDEIEIVCEGPDEVEALEAVTKLIESGMEG